MKEQKKKFTIVLLAVFLTGGLFFAGIKNRNIKNNYLNDSTSVSMLTEGKKEKKINYQAVKTKESISLLFLGDLMADRYIRQVIEKKGIDYIFSGTQELFKKEDLVVANLEGPITNENSISVNTFPGEKNHLHFTFNPFVASALASNNIKLVNIGNNHISNFGQSGFEATKKYLGEARVEYFGDIHGKNDYIIKNINGTRIGFVNYNQFSPGSYERALNNIKETRNQADIIIVFTHWGIEYNAKPPEKVKDMAHKFIDEGANLIIGTHPHVVGTIEAYKDKKIYYSLGNFIFDQYFSEETKNGLAVEVKINSDKSMDFRNINLSLETNGKTIVAP